MLSRYTGPVPGKAIAMPYQPMTDSQLSETSGRQFGSGTRLLLAGVVLYVVGGLLWALDASMFAGLMLIGLGTPVLVAGIALLLSGGVGRRASQQKPFA